MSLTGDLSVSIRAGAQEILHRDDGAADTAALPAQPSASDTDASWPHGGAVRTQRKGGLHAWWGYVMVW